MKNSKKAAMLTGGSNRPVRALPSMLIPAMALSLMAPSYDAAVLHPDSCETHESELPAECSAKTALKVTLLLEGRHEEFDVLTGCAKIQS